MKTAINRIFAKAKKICLLLLLIALIMSCMFLDVIANVSISPVSSGLDLTGKSYDDLIFYENRLADDPSRILAALHKGNMIINQYDFLNAKIESERYGNASIVNVYDMPFYRALEITVNQAAHNPWDFQLVLPQLKNNIDYKDGDILFMSFYMKTLETIDDYGIGRIQVISEKSTPPNAKALELEISTVEGQDWLRVCIPFKSKEDYDSLLIRLGFEIQTILLGGFELVNYRNSVNIKDLPVSLYSGDAAGIFNKEEQWRIDAWNRIDEHRKGDLTIVVKDVCGNPIENAIVKVNMVEHEFQWGTAINEKILLKDENGVKYRDAVSSLFNSVVLENSHKWNQYENEYALNSINARMQVNAAKNLNIKYIRGHTLVWDKAFVNGWVYNNLLPKDVYDLLVAGNLNSLNKRIKDHILRITGDFRGELIDWDVANEVIENNAIRSKYGNSVLIDWFKWAREGSPDSKLFINETTHNTLYSKQLNVFLEILDYMVEHNVNFDGIGIQGHFRDAMVHPMVFYNTLNKLSKYGKEIKITEFDVGAMVSSLSREFEASFVRDIMIMAFSHEMVTGFYMWGFWSGSHWQNNAPVFDSDWTLKESGKQYIDLVYNKWWTQESGKTDTQGAYKLRGFYGEYEVTIDVNGIISTIKISFQKGKENTFIFTVI